MISLVYEHESFSPVAEGARIPFVDGGSIKVRLPEDNSFAGKPYVDPNFVARFADEMYDSDSGPFEFGGKIEPGIPLPKSEGNEEVGSLRKEIDENDAEEDWDDGDDDSPIVPNDPIDFMEDIL